LGTVIKRVTTSDETKEASSKVYLDHLAEQSLWDYLTSSGMDNGDGAFCPKLDNGDGALDNGDGAFCPNKRKNDDE